MRISKGTIQRLLYTPKTNMQLRLTATLAIAILFACLVTNAQTKEEPLREVIPRIEKAYHIRFSYQENLLAPYHSALQGPINGSISLSKVLDTVLHHNGLNYIEISSKYYTI